jgi:hypothetical protein
VPERPLRITRKLVDHTIDGMTGILERQPLDTRLASVRDLFERGRRWQPRLKALAIWERDDRDRC